MVSFSDLRDRYERNWSNLKVRADRLDEAKKEADRLLKGKSTYQQVESRTGVPWWFVGLCHYRESHFDFDTYLGNGQHLSRTTTIVPKGRGPFTGPNAFVDGAVDALRLEGFAAAADWSIARTLFRLEGFNGFGYQSRGVNSPYLYGASNMYGPPEARGGKFVRDHVFDPNFVDTQLGTAVILKVLLDLDQSIKLDGAPSMVSVSPEPDEVLGETVLMIQRSLNKIGADPQLAEDGKNGPRTKEAISKFQRQSGLPDTGIPDGATIAAIAQKAAAPASQMQISSDVILQIIQRLETLGRTIQTSGGTASLPNDPVEIAERLLGLAQKAAPQPGTASLPNTKPDSDPLQKAIAILAALAGGRTNGKLPLGQVNGALGETIGNLLDGKKTAIGIGGSLITTLLAAVTSSPSAGGLAGLFGTIATSVPGLSQFALPIFLAMSAWGVLGKVEKWAQGTAPPPKP
jgi:lysozyme family protein/peptidoglycan hydrolase-like protein with peptidoglycan-binding domain